jgi:hypothetical protein
MAVANTRRVAGLEPVAETSVAARDEAS